MALVLSKSISLCGAWRRIQVLYWIIVRIVLEMCTQATECFFFQFII